MTEFSLEPGTSPNEEAYYSHCRTAPFNEVLSEDKLWKT
jgi:hypothetical protein